MGTNGMPQGAAQQGAATKGPKQRSAVSQGAGGSGGTMPGIPSTNNPAMGAQPGMNANAPIGQPMSNTGQSVQTGMPGGGVPNK